MTDCFGEKAKRSKQDYCSWCWELAGENKKKKVPVYACIPFGQSGWETPDNVCRDCLLGIINNEIENLRTCPSDDYDGKEWLVPFEIESIYRITFEGLN